MTHALIPVDVAPIPRITLRRAEAALALGISERTLADWTKKGKIPTVKVGDIVLYSVDTLREWAAGDGS